MLEGLLGPLDAGAKATQVKLAEAQMEFIVLPSPQKKKSQMWSSGMAGSRSSKPAPSPGSAFCACAPPPGGAFVGWQRQPWVALGFHSPYLATSEEAEPLIPQCLSVSLK